MFLQTFDEDLNDRIASYHQMYLKNNYSISMQQTFLNRGSNRIRILSVSQKPKILQKMFNE